MKLFYKILGSSLLTFSFMMTACTGPQGPRGPEGDVGSRGPSGQPGPIGSAGSAGERGPAGPAGQNGNNGADGADGADGVDGLTPLFRSTEIDADPEGPCEFGGSLIEIGYDEDGSEALDEEEVAYSEAICNGAPGAQGEPGPQGPQGEPGEPGEPGVCASSEEIVVNSVTGDFEYIDFEAAVRIAVNIEDEEIADKVSVRFIGTATINDKVEPAPEPVLQQDGSYGFTMDWTTIHSSSQAIYQYIVVISDGCTMTIENVTVVVYPLPV